METAELQDSANVSLMLDKRIKDTVVMAVAEALCDPESTLLNQVEISINTGDPKNVRMMLQEVFVDAFDQYLGYSSPYAAATYNLLSRIRDMVREEVRCIHREQAVRNHALQEPKKGS